MLRFSVALLASFAVVGGLFWSLWIMINRSVEIGEVQRATKIEFTRLRRDSEAKTRSRQQKVEREKPVEVQPNADLALSLGSSGSTGAAIDPLPMQADARADLSGVSFGFAGGGGRGGAGAATAGGSRDVVPLVRIQPDYPSRAAQRGIEGYVIVRFTITVAGTIKDAAVVTAEPEGVFETAALSAIRRWKYNPKIEAGTPVEQPGVQVRLTFELEQ